MATVYGENTGGGGAAPFSRSPSGEKIWYNYGHGGRERREQNRRRRRAPIYFGGALVQLAGTSPMARYYTAPRNCFVFTRSAKKTSVFTAHVDLWGRAVLLVLHHHRRAP
jgi:hypothetical protein